MIAWEKVAQNKNTLLNQWISININYLIHVTISKINKQNNNLRNEIKIKLKKNY